MNLVSPSLRRPITVVVLVIAVCLGAWVALQRMTRDIFPPPGIPTIYVTQVDGEAGCEIFPERVSFGWGGGEEKNKWCG